MPDNTSKVAAAKNVLAGANKAFPSPKTTAPITAPPAAAAPKSTSGVGEPEKGIGAELAAKSANVDAYMKALPKMHKGGPVLADGGYHLKMGEHVLAPGEADKARKHAMLASGMKSLANPGKATTVKDSSDSKKTMKTPVVKGITVRPEKMQAAPIKMKGGK
jgi:hypothetical protein